MNSKVRVLVFPCGSESASEIHQALRHSVHVELFGASSVEDHGRVRFQNYIGDVPNIADASFDASFARIVADHSIDMVFATHDTVLDYLAPRADALGFFLVNGDAAATHVARRKSATYTLFDDCAWSPAMFSNVDAVKSWPAVVKPDLGQGGQGVAVVRNANEAWTAIEATRHPVLVEYLPGEEITVDCFTDFERELVWAGPRTRERVRAGISMRSRFVELTPDIREIAETINARVAMRGPWFFQLKRAANGEWKLLEISCRIAGTMVAQRARGINLPLMAVQDFMKRKLLPLDCKHVPLIERNIATRAVFDYEYDDVFVDLDDTLIIDGRVTPSVIAFLYQAQGDGKRITLITRHRHDVNTTLRDARIGAGLFDAIIHIDDIQRKSAHIKERAIFVDNHFPERLDVSRENGIPVFDVDRIEFLLR
ncbi:carbamoyl phosphate synthase-like protein [Caballeronia fortuita]|uniref:Carbamoyl phosphate synthase-like protein n=1 Tax=Caballeronia fortuita TaxID=1777138 RepID=A0A158DYX1_9BURK|nr:ATP-grasp domain-containing protein [Caballeronia fortuita]SAK99812.1 carbamoyl phosphate synthase-like protein [Caballeronia fortuita]